MLTDSIDPFGQLTILMYVLDMYNFILPGSFKLTIVTSLFLQENLPCYLLLVSIQNLCLHMLRFHFQTWQYFDYNTMALHMNNGHIIYCYMDATQSVGLVQPNCVHFNYLVI